MPMTPEVRQKWTEAWREAQKAKDERRRLNREKWAKRRDWSDDNEHKLEADVAIEPNGEGSDSLRAMRKIMADTNAQLYRRLDAAECVLTYELGPAAAVGADPATIAAASYRFLKTVAEDASVPEGLRFRALRSVLSVENVRASITNTAANDAVKRQLWLGMLNATRSARLRRSGQWPPPDDSWAFKEADVELPRSWIGQTWPPTEFAALLDTDASDLKAELAAMAESHPPPIRRNPSVLEGKEVLPHHLPKTIDRISISPRGHLSGLV
jgi:hypothetical protein